MIIDETADLDDAADDVVDLDPVVDVDGGVDLQREAAGDVADDVLQREAEAIPLQQRELAVVQPAAFAGAEHLAQLVDIAAACREQPLHRVFRRGVQVALRPSIRRLDREGFDRRVGGRRRADGGCFGRAISVSATHY